MVRFATISLSWRVASWSPSRPTACRQRRSMCSRWSRADGELLSSGELRRGLARQIAREARDLLSDKTGFRFGPDGETKRIEPGDIYVLTATNKEAVVVSRALREAEVPFAFYKQEGLFQTDQARAIHDLLAAIADPADVDKRRSRLDHAIFRRPAGSSARAWVSCPTRARSSSGYEIGIYWLASTSSRRCSPRFSTRLESSAASCF